MSCSPFYFAPITESLSSLPKLRNLTVSVARPDRYLMRYRPPLLRRFKNLSSFRIRCWDEIPVAYCELEIASVIAASPGLTQLSLCIQPPANSDTECWISLQSFLGESRPELVQLELERVSLPATGLDRIISHNLRCLSLTTTSSPRNLEFAWAQLWSALRNAGAKLSTLTVRGSEEAMDEMFSYLISYTGLQDLNIYDILMTRQELEDSAGRKFWQQVVPHHQDSLVKLCINPCHEGAWCYGSVSAQQSDSVPLFACLAYLYAAWTHPGLKPD